ncbi:hypothetical protein NECAME_01749 [Necator americanus]|uniref:Uncharacterized protein n=1 Tax=Necator americanus TaxID=51031 RepID=W2TQY6_NECAM|nr:hypothetical protein NECAME_01749 [Necator americanus]ETN83442.1 hypothetical protein NECAME_01749 [Necator americanus]
MRCKAGFSHPTFFDLRNIDIVLASYVFPNSTILLHGIVFAVFVLLLLYPPDAFVGAGVTFDNLAYGYLGTSESNILDFQCRRFVLTRSFIGLLVLSLFLVQEHAVVFTIHPSRIIHYVALISPLLALGALLYFVYHTVTGFSSIFPMKKMKNYGYDPRQVFTILSNEFGRLDAFRHTISNVSKLVITDSWLFHCSRFNFVVVKLADVQFLVINAEDTMNGLHQALGMNQYLTIAVSLPADISALNFVFKCVSCMARIFLAKQDQSVPSRWLEGTCPCPTCRATFCVMDVALLSHFDEENSSELNRRIGEDIN